MLGGGLTAPQYSLDCSTGRAPSVAPARSLGRADRTGEALSFLRCELLVLMDVSLISSKQLSMLNAINAALPNDGFEEKSMCEGLISNATVSSLTGESCGGGARYNLERGSTFECFLPGRWTMERFGA